MWYPWVKSGIFGRRQVPSTFQPKLVDEEHGSGALRQRVQPVLYERPQVVASLQRKEKEKGFLSGAVRGTASYGT